MFFRIKKIKGKEYAYLVENKWKTTAVGTLKTRGSRQHVKQYLGRAHKFALSNNIDFSNYYKIRKLDEYLAQKTFKQIIADLVRWELYRHDVKNLTVDLENKILQKNNKDVVAMINEGLLCRNTIGNLIDFKATGDEKQDAFALAKAFVEAGIKVPQELFIGLFGKLYKN